jgi:hypothetical protein
LKGQPVPPDPTAAERIALGLEHIRRQRLDALRALREERGWRQKPEDALRAEAERRALGGLLPHVMWYVWGVPGVGTVRRALSQARSASDLEVVLQDFGARQAVYAAAEGGPPPALEHGSCETAWQE